MNIRICRAGRASTESFRTRQHAWLVANAGDHGWFLPDWAQRGGTRPEPWHWEYSGTQ